MAIDTAVVSTAERKPNQAGMSRRPAAGIDPALVPQLVAQARERGPQLCGEGGLPQQLTKIVLESALDGELIDHLGTTSTTRPKPTAVTAATVPAPRPS